MASGKSDRYTGARNRDEFSLGTKERIAKRAGYMCAFPNCRQLTIGPSNGRVSGVTQVGIAAHITAAAAGGPRYDANLTPEERSGEENGVWVCQNHGKLIDDSPDKYGPEDIKRWKKQHEEWVESRVANSENYLGDGISRVSIQDVGIFNGRIDIKLGRYNVVYGSSVAGKSTICEAIAAFSGQKNYNHFSDRFKFCRGSVGDAMIEAVVSHNHTATTVQLSQQELPVRRASNLPPAQRLRIEIDGNIAPTWPLSFFNVINLNDHFFETHLNFKRNLRNAISSLSEQLKVDQQIIWDMLDEEIFLTSTFGFRLKRTGVRTVKFRVPDGRDFYLPFSHLSTTEQALAIIDILLKYLRADSRNLPWFVAFDSDFFRRFTTSGQGHIFNKITNNTSVPLQAIFIVHDERDADSIRINATDNWIGVDVVRGLTIHRFV